MMTTKLNTEVVEDCKMHMINSPGCTKNSSLRRSASARSIRFHYPTIQKINETLSPLWGTEFITLDPLRPKTESMTLGSDFLSFFQSKSYDMPSILAFINDKFKEHKETALALTGFVAFFYQMCRATSYADYTAALFQWISPYLLHDSSIQKYFLDATYSLYAAVSKTIGTESVGKSIDKFVTGIKLLLTSSMVTTIRDLILSLVSLKMFSRETAKNLCAFLGQSKPTTILGLLNTFSETITKFITLADAYFAGIPLSECLLSDDPIDASLSASATLLAYEDFLYSGQYVEGKMHRSKFLIGITQQHTFLSGVASKLRSSSDKSKQVNAVILKLTAAKLKVLNYLRANKRAAPPCICIHGLPGVGKSKIIDLICGLMSLVLGIEDTEYLRYVRVRGSPYHDGCDPLSQLYYLYSEMANMKGDVVKARGDPIMEEFLSLIDDQRFPLNFAFEKGMYCANPALVIMDTNTWHLNFDFMFNAPAAARRRIIFVDVSVRDEFRKDGSCEIDPTKSLNDDSYILDRWVFNVSRQLAVDNRSSNTKVLLNNGDVYAFTNLMTQIFQEHAALTSRILDEVGEGLNYKDLVEEAKKRLDPVELFVAEEEKVADIVDEDVVVEDLQPLHGVADLKSESGEQVPVIDVNDFVRKEPSRIPDLEETTWLFQRLDSVLPWATIDIQNAFSHVPEISYNLLNCVLYSTLSYFFLFLLSGFAPGTLLVFWTIILWKYIYMAPLQLFSLSLFGLVVHLQKAALLQYFIAFSMHTLQRMACRRYENWKVRVYNSWTLFRFKLGSIDSMPLAPKTVDSMRFESKMLAAGAVVTLLYVGVQYYTNKKTEASTFLMESPANVPINTIEKDCDCSKSYPRVQVKDTNVWNTVIGLPIPQQCLSPVHEISSTISRNMRHVKIHNDGVIRVTKILGIYSNLAVINRHALGKNFSGLITISVCPEGYGRDSLAYKQTILDVAELRVFNQDLVYIRVNEMMFRDIRCYFPETRSIIPKTTIGYIDGKETSVCTLKRVEITDEALGNIIYDECFHYKWADHSQGACGTPLLGKVGGVFQIIGIHSAGANRPFPDSYAIPISKDTFPPEDGFHILSQGPVNTECLEMPIAKSVFRYEVLQNLDYLGKIPGPVKINKASKVTRSPCAEIYEEILEEELDDRYGPPVMKPYTKNGTYYSPMNLAIKSMATTKRAVDPRLIRKAEKKLFRMLMQSLKKLDVKLAPIDMETAINAVEYDCYLRAMSSSTAGGFGYPGAKKDYIPIVSEFPQTREAVDKLKQDVLNLMESYDKGLAGSQIYNAAFKDEPRSASKIETANTRLFCVSPLPGLIVARMFLAPLYTLMQEHGDIFMSSVGVNIYKGADSMCRKLKKFNLFMEGDYKNYDLKIPFSISEMSARLQYDVLKELGYNAKALRMLAGLLTDNLFPLVNFFCDLIGAAGLQPSGKFGTAEDNCLKNLCLFYVFWVNCPQSAHLDFREYVLAYFYGDDMIAAISDFICEWFNNVTYQIFCRDVYGMEYTDSSKSSIMRKWLKFEEIGYLKRNFLFSEEFNRYIAPIDRLSMLKSGTLFIPSRSVDTSKQLLDSACSFLWEMFLHTDVNGFNRARNILCEKLPGALFLSEEHVRDTLPQREEIRKNMFKE